MPFEWKFDTKREFRNKVQRWQRGLLDLRWFWRRCVGPVADAHAAMFDAEGPGWIPLAPMTVRLRQSRQRYYSRPSSEGPNARILHWTHGLRNSLASRARNGTRLSVRLLGTDSMTWGTSHPAAEELHRVRPMLATAASLEAVMGEARAIIPRWLNRAGNGTPPSGTF